MTTKLSAVQGLKADIIDAGSDRALDRARAATLERVEQDVLQVDGQRQQPVEERRDRRQLVLDAVGVGELKPGRVLEDLQRTALDLALYEKEIELAQRVARIVDFPDCPRRGTGPARRSGAGPW